MAIGAEVDGIGFWQDVLDAVLALGIGSSAVTSCLELNYGTFDGQVTGSQHSTVDVSHPTWNNVEGGLGKLASEGTCGRHIHGIVGGGVAGDLTATVAANGLGFEVISGVVILSVHGTVEGEHQVLAIQIHVG